MNFTIINMYYIKAGRVKSDYANITRFTPVFEEREYNDISTLKKYM